MDIGEIARMVLALAVTLGLIGLAATAARKFAPGALFRFKPASERRLQVVESLILDPARRLVLVRFDNTERLLLLGEGRMLEAPAAAAAAKPAPRKTRPARAK
ncbi:MAG: flagellar biosynthetic protein FliO [Caulobacteraceae bacterium]